MPEGGRSVRTRAQVVPATREAEGLRHPRRTRIVATFLRARRAERKRFSKRNAVKRLEIVGDVGGD